ncbi:MAG TPA: hypothetical protein DCQ92_01730 [Verrucomicrobia subdivision 3 bacterium]|nr:hypothetical protein [Limisphaerales bacterium]
MKPRLSQKRNAAMTLFEVGVVVAAVVVLAAAFLPMLATSRKKVSKLGCTNCLKQIGLAYRIWEGDNGDIYPMGVSVTSGGSMEMVQTGNVVQTFQVMSNELSTPKVLICPNDTNRSYASSFAGLANSNISYFIGVDVTNDANPQMIISGDCNFRIGGVPVKPGLQAFWTNDPVAWTATRHVSSGNIGLADGSVQSATSKSLQNYFQQTGLATNRLAIP